MPRTTRPLAGRARATQRWTLAAVLTATAILMLDVAVVNTALPTLAGDLRADLHDLKWVLDAYTLALASVVLSAGSLADRIGRRRVFVAGLVVFTTASAAAAAAGSITFLNVARAVQGLGAAGMFAVSLAILADAFPAGRERAGALAAYGATIGSAFALGPLAGGAITSVLGWRWVFLVNVPIGIAALTMAFARVRESRDPHPRRIDVPGQLVLIPGLLGLVYGLLRAAETGWGEATVLVSLGAAGAFLVAFIAIESRSPAPMLPLALLRDPGFAGAQVAAFAISAGLFALFVYLVVYLQQVLGLTPVQTGLTLIPGTLLNAIAAGASARLTGRLHPARLVAAGLALVAIGLTWMTAAGADSSWLALQPGFMVAMLGTGLFNPAASAMTLAVPERMGGLAVGIHDTARQAGVAVGVAALGTFIPAAAGLGTGDPHAYVDGLHAAFLAGAGLAAAGATVALAMTRRAGRRVGTQVA